MSRGLPGGLAGRRVAIPPVRVLVPALVLVISALAWLFQRILGVPGIVFLVAGLLGALVATILLIRYPVIMCMIWFISMSGLQTLGMISMPGLPDFSLARLSMVLVMLAGATAAAGGRNIFKPPFTPELLLIAHAAYVLANMYAIGDATRFNTWLASSLAPIVGYSFAKNFVNEDRHIRDIIVAFVLVSVYFWLTCIGEKFEIAAIVWPRWILDRDIGISWFGRSRGPFLQPGLTGQFLGWYIMAQIYLMTRQIPRSVKLVIAVNIVMCSVGLFLTYTRGPWLATVVGLLAMAALRPNYRRFMFGVGIVVVLATGTNALRPSNDEFLGERLANTDTIDNRLGFLAAALRMIHHQPLFGIGYFRYLDVLPDYNQGTYIPMYGFVARGAGKNVPIHDIYIGRAAEEGVLSLVLFAAVMFVLFHHFRRRWAEADAKSWFDRDFLALYAGVMASYFVNGMTLDYRYFDFVNVFPFFLSGIVVAFPRVQPVGLGRRGRDAPGDIRVLT